MNYEVQRYEVLGSSLSESTWQAATPASIIALGLDCVFEAFRLAGAPIDALTVTRSYGTVETMTTYREKATDVA